MDFGLDKIKGFQATTMFGVIGGSILPGFLFVFIFNRELFLNLDKFLLCLISPSLSLPFLIFNSGLILFGLFYGHGSPTIDEATRHNYFSLAVFLGNIITSIIVYSTILIGYFFQFSMKKAVISIVIFETVVAVVLIFLLVQEIMQKINREKTTNKIE
jgi:hypothetical protein